MSSKEATQLQERLRHLPSVSEVDRHLAARGLPSGKAVRDEVQDELARIRRAALEPGGTAPAREAVLAAIEQRLGRPAGGRLQPVINATGVVVHTNLGRAVLAPPWLADVAPLLAAYSNLEFDLQTGKRGARGGRVPQLLARLAGAEAALVVNNNAAAVLLLLSALAGGREVIVSRGELVEIGGAFRVPDIMRQSGARLVEVGTTNRTRIADYADAITPDTAALLKVHRSNFVMSGFVEETSVAELATLGAARGVPVWHDLGSGNFYRFAQPALRGIPTVEQELRAGADVLTFSGDKLLGSVQAGIVVGRAEPLRAMQRHPLYRSLRLDKLRLAVLERSLLDYLDIEQLRANNRVVALLERTPEEMTPLARTLLDLLQRPTDAPLSWELVRDQSLPGGGALPEVRIDTLCLALQPGDGNAEALATRLRQHQPPVVARVQEGRLLLDFRTIFESDLPALAAAIMGLCRVP